MTTQSVNVRRLIIILGDQLNTDSKVFEGFDPKLDLIWIAEAFEESTHVPSSKPRIVMFLSAMRHFATEIISRGWRLDYTYLNAPLHSATLMGELEKAITKYSPKELVVAQPGDYRTLQNIKNSASKCSTSLTITPDNHFFTEAKDFEAYANARKQLRMEYWYRELRQKFNVLMDNGKPVGDQWNFDADNRKSFGKSGPKNIPDHFNLNPDSITLEVIELVNEHFKNHVGELDSFAWPVSRKEALDALNKFIHERLPLFGDYEDAMWTDEPWLYHSHISPALNLKLLNPKEVVSAAENAYRTGAAPLAAVEGFIRQILGWREYVRGMYWLKMPSYLGLNSLNATHKLPDFYWTGKTEMVCLSQVINQTLKHGYANHIQRLMVLGLYTLMYGVHPVEVHEWFLSVFVDAVEWVELPNTLGMSQYGDGGLMASKPYIASGKYVQRMSNYCASCPYDPAESIGPKACPMTTLYWDFLIRHKELMKQNNRMSMQLKNLDRLSEDKIVSIQAAAQAHRSGLVSLNKFPR